MFLSVQILSSVARAEGTDYEPDDYVRDGMTAQWDCLRNDGLLRPANRLSRRWRDLVGNNDFFLLTAGGWSDDGALRVSGLSAQADVCASYRTIEAVFKGGGGYSAAQTIFHGGEMNHAIMRVPDSKFVAFTNGGSMPGVPISGENGVMEYVAGVYNAASTATTAAYGSGALVSPSVSIGCWYGRDATASFIGQPTVTKAANSPYWIGWLYALRVHSRELTADEIAVNHALDLMRFEHASAATAFASVTAPVMVLSGSLGTATPGYGSYVFTEATERTCSIDFATQLYADEVEAVPVRDGVRAVFGGYTLKSPSGTVLASHATAKSFTYTVTSPVLASWNFTWQYRHDFSTTEHGTIAYGDEKGLSAKSGWIARGTSVTLTAEPAAGYAFAGWSGDTDGLDASAAALVFVADRPRNLVAHFKVKYDWSATSYVRNGLVVQYDGLDNAGFCTNDATATTWRNLSVNGRDAMKNGDYAMPVWESDGIVWTNASVAASLYIPGSDALESVGTNDCTVEISATAAMPSSMNTGLLALWPMYTGGYQSAFTMRAGYSKIYVGYKTGQFSCVEGSSIKNSRFNMTFVRKQKDAQFTVYYDGAKYGDYSAAEGYCSVNWATLGRSASDAMLAGFKGNVHAVRIYSRALTAAEVERNNLVDRARFWGEDTGDSRLDDEGNVIYRIRFAYDASVGTLRANGADVSDGGYLWVKSGDSLDLSFAVTDGDAHDFYQWEGLLASDWPYGTNATYVVTEPKTLRARTSNVHYVTTDGDDAAGDGTRAKPFATVQRALAASDDFAEIRVKGGCYLGCVTNAATHHLVKNLFLRGSYNDDWEQDLRNSRTVLKSPKTTLDVIRLVGVQTNRFDGLDITGGAYGIFAANAYFDAESMESQAPYRHHFVTRCAVTNNTASGIYHYGGGTGWSNGGDYGFAVASSLIAFNGERGISQRLYYTRNAHGYYYNCTILSNGQHGVSGTGTFQSRLRNSIIAFNGTRTGYYDLFAENQAAYMILNDCCAFGGSAGVEGGDFLAYGHVDTFLSVDPKLTAAFGLSAASPCNKRGVDLSGNGIVPVDTDLYGTPWNGEYDFGCIKSAHPAVTPVRYDELWVAADGSDANVGNDPEHPLATLSEAQYRLNDGGTIHLGEGTYGQGVVLRGTGVRLLGAGRDRTFVKMSAGTAVAVLGSFAEVADISIVGAACGVRLENTGGIAPTNVVVRDCAFGKCTADGWYMQQGASNSGAFTNHVVCCLFTNCETAVALKGLSSGVRGYGDLRVEGCRMTGGTYGFYSSCQPSLGSALIQNRHWLVNCTIVSNKTHGVDFDVWLNAYCDNCIIADNGQYNVKLCDWGNLYLRNTFAGGKTSVTNCTVTANAHIWTTDSNLDFTDLADLKFSSKPGRDYRLKKTSPAGNFGRRAWTGERYRHDLDGRLKPTGQLDAGCYFADKWGRMLIVR